MIWQDILKTLSGIKADLSIPLPNEQPSSLIPTLKYRMTLALYFSYERGTKQSCGCTLYATKGQKAYPHKRIQADRHPVR